MDPLVIYPQRWKLVLSGFAAGLCFVPAANLFFQFPMFSGAFALHAWFEGSALLERGLGLLLMAIVSYAVGGALTRIIWPEPVIFADRSGLTVNERHIPWSEFRHVRVGGVRINGVPVRHLEVLGPRKITVPNSLVAGTAESMAQAIMDYAVKVRSAAAPQAGPRAPAAI